MPDEGSAHSLSVQIALAEFAELRAEIANRSNAQNTLMTLNLTAIGGIGGLVLSNKSYVLLLLLLPILSPALGLLFLDHAINIKKIGNYIKGDLKKTLTAAGGSADLMRYEEVVSKYEQRTLLRFLPFGLPLFLMFGAVPVGCLALTLWSVGGHGGWDWTLWGTGALMTLAYFSFWQFFMWAPSSI